MNLDSVGAGCAAQGAVQRPLTEPAELRKGRRADSVDEVWIDREEFITGLVALAVPVRAADGGVCAAIAVHAPAV